MAVKKWVWWFIVGFVVLVVLGYFFYVHSKTTIIVNHDTELFTQQSTGFILNRQSAEPAELVQLFKQLKKDKFAIEARSLDSTGFVACTQKESRTYKGSGIREYYMRRPIGIGIASGQVYPDFLLQIFEFKSASEAEEHAKWIQNRGMLWDDDCISGMTSKGPEKIVVNGQTVYVLSARADMLRTFTEKYGEQLAAN